MQRFGQLIEELNNTTKTNDKRDALLHYFSSAPDEDKVWVIATSYHSVGCSLVSS